MTVQDQTRPLDEAKMGAIMGQMVNDIGALLSASLITVGEKLGLYEALAEAGPVTPAELAARTGTSERYLQEWLLNQAASGYTDYDPGTGRYSLSPEQALVLADTASPAYMAGLFKHTAVFQKAVPRLKQAFLNGEGLLWAEQDHDIFEGQFNISRGGIIMELIPQWIPALEGVQARLEAGATVADIGCGYGLSTVTLAQAYPRSRFYGYDSHALSIEKARRLAEEAGVSDRVTFEAVSATDYPARRYDLIAFLDSFHDMGNTTAIARHAYETLVPDGSIMLVEPAAGDNVEDNFNPVGRLFSAVAVSLCVPNSLAQGGPALGPLVTDATLQEVFGAAGFSRFRRSLTTPFNRVFEIRP